MQIHLRQLQKSGIALVTAALLSILPTMERAHADQVVVPVKAVWDVQEIFLSYFGLTTYYSCDSLRDKVRTFVKQLGAHEATTVSSAGCTEITGPDRLPGARIVLVTPRTATPELLANYAKDTKRADLIAKLESKGAKIDSGEFDAVRKTVVLNTKDDGNASAAGDCELLEHLRDQIIKKMDAKVVKDNLGCTPGQGTVGNRTLSVEVLAKR